MKAKILRNKHNQMDGHILVYIFCFNICFNVSARPPDESYNLLKKNEPWHVRLSRQWHNNGL